MYVTRILGGQAVSLGLIEGTADALSSLLKIVAGRLSDSMGRRRPLVIAGYALASAARPLVALATSWTHVFLVRLIDRTGKGLRGAPRDAMLATLAPSGMRGRVFGFHRAMDHAGAVVGPIVASIFLWLFPEQYRLLFALTIVPGIIAVALLFFVPEDEPTRAGLDETPARVADTRSGRPSGRPTTATDSADSAVDDEPRPPLPAPLKRFFWILALFTLGNSSDAFLLLRLSDAGLPVAGLPLAWAALHVMKSSLSTLGGSLSDRLGRRTLIIGGWLVFAVVYAGFALSTSAVTLVAWLLIYGIHFALVEGSEKALVADLTPEAVRGAAFGWYNAVLGFGALAASLLFAAIWQSFGAPAAFLTGAGLSLAASALMLTVPARAEP